MRKNLFKIKSLGALLFLAVFLFNNASSSSAANSFSSNEATWTFDSATDFTISDTSKLSFFDSSTKLTPTGFEKDWGGIWHDTHFAPNDGDSEIYGIAVDSSNYIYLAGWTNSGQPGATYYAFTVKLDQNLNEIWYKRDYFADTSGFHRIVFAEDGNLVTQASYISAGQAYTRLMKINPTTGAVIWSTDIAKGNNWINPWDSGAGPVIDSNGNIYIAQANGAAKDGCKSEPLGIYKFDSSGTILWSQADNLASYYPGADCWCDLWDMVVDSEGSTYLSVTANMTLVARDLDFGLVKFDTNGNRVWTKAENWADRWDAPRGVAIDSNDNIYQNGNAGDNLRGGILEYDKDGTLLYKSQFGLLADDTAYPWGSKMDKFDQWVITIDHEYTGGILLEKFLGTDLSLINKIEYANAPRLGAASRPGRVAFDRYGNSYGVSWLPDANYSDKYSAVVLKGVNTYPNTTPGSGTALTLINKTPVNYDTLSGFSVTYGLMDQADVKFQISNDGEKWYFWNGLLWVETVGYGSNTEAEVNQNISKFSDQFGPGQFYFKSFMITDGTKEVDLKSVTITKDQLLNVLPATGKDENNTALLIASSLLFFILITSALVKRSNIKI